MLRTMSNAIRKTKASTKRCALTTTNSRAFAAGGQNPIFKPWPMAVVETHGDYTQEAWLEDHIGGPLYSHQKSLPRLPVPSIENTLKRFLPTAIPLARTEEERLSLQRAVNKFPEQASQLQERLLQRREETSNSSWLQHWWNTLGYLQVRESVVINVSYFFHFMDDPSATHVETSSPAGDDHIGQRRRAAAILTACAEHRKLVCSGQFPAEMVGKKDKQKPLCSAAYKYMFHATRIPASQQDSVKIYDPSRNNHAIVAVKGHFFSLDFCDPITGEAFPLSVLEDGLMECQAMALEMSNQGWPQLGWLTSDNRDDWAAARNALLDVGGKTLADALELLESGAVLITLDDAVPVSRRECAGIILYGGYPEEGSNRWFDKSVTLMVTANGKAGLLGEHSMMDGMPMVTLANRITELTYDKCEKMDNSTGMKCSTNVRPVFVDVFQDPNFCSQAETLIAKAKHDYKEWTVDKHEINVQSFQGYGSSFIKKAGYSPDAFVQMAMQLATFRLWGEQAGTYEATQVRPFLHGRTETTRTVSPESANMCELFGFRPKADEIDPDMRKEKLQALKDAVAAHVNYLRLAGSAQGVDRHFLGLSMTAANGEQLPDLYSDPVFARAKRWRVSTSNLSHPKFLNWGYGEVVPDGVGLSYSIHPRHLVFSVTALKEHAWTDKLCSFLEEALLEMRMLIELEQREASSRL